MERTCPGGLIIDIRRIGAGDPLEFEVVSSVKEEAKQLIVCDGYARQRMDILGRPGVKDVRLLDREATRWVLARTGRRYQTSQTGWNASTSAGDSFLGIEYWRGPQDRGLSAWIARRRTLIWITATGRISGQCDLLRHLVAAPNELGPADGRMPCAGPT